jgi:hypothetical protein
MTKVLVHLGILKSTSSDLSLLRRSHKQVDRLIDLMHVSLVFFSFL